MIEVCTREVLRYLGYKKRDTATPEVLADVDSCLQELHQAAVPRDIYRIFPCQVDTQAGCVTLPCATFKSSALARHLAGCREAVLFAATLGSGVDILIHRYSHLQISRAVILQACAAAMVEAFCDARQAEILRDLPQRRYARPRFSPGYGDFALENQRAFTAVLEAPKRIGLTLTEGDLMVPTKSVTAIIGLDENPTRTGSNPCAECSLTHCTYRRLEEQ
ncbi:methionine synthase [uncultured Clostridium sp.]|nr:methionine synthase [uncultured Clostridium sp.]